MEAIQAQLSAATLERDALKREVLAQRTPTAVEAQPAAIAAAVTAAAVNKFKGRS